MDAQPKVLLNTFDENRNIIELMRGRKILAIKVALQVSKLKLKKSDSENGKTNINTYHIEVNHNEQSEKRKSSFQLEMHLFEL